LLRILQEKEFERVGGTKSLSVDTRIISATNMDLKSAVAGGRFREDLYYRLNVFPIALPTLKERSEAILPLAQYFALKFGASFGKKISGFTEDAKSALFAYRWPGNIRELQNVIERAVILSSGVIDITQLNLETSTGATDAADGLLKLGEKELIRKTLLETKGNRREAAEMLGISLRTLQYRIKQYEL
jgi:transcriptional regulator with PAS, ATPase and Fis domain